MKGVTSMATTNINVRVDCDLKQSAEALFADLGLNMTSAITMFLRSAVSHDGIPFEVKRVTPNAETKAALAEYSEMKKNPGQYKRYGSFDELLDEVLTDA
jgi:DNA-damage-inducible protein J